MDENEDFIEEFILDRRRSKDYYSITAVSIVAVIITVIVCITLVALFRPENQTIPGIIIAFVGISIQQFFSLMKSHNTENTTKQLHEALNGHLKEFVKEIKEKALEEGKRSPRTPRPGQGS